MFFTDRIVKNKSLSARSFQFLRLFILSREFVVEAAASGQSVVAVRATTADKSLSSGQELRKTGRESSAREGLPWELLKC